MKDFYDYNGHSYSEYEDSHKARLDFLVEDLKLNELNGKIVDLGSGLGHIFNRLKPEIQKNYVGYDFTDLINPPFEYHKVDFNNFEIEDNEVGKYDYAFCFETIEHLQNPYNCLIQTKRMLKLEHILYLSIPHSDCLHNFIYPGNFIPTENFITFLNQLAFEILDYRIHDKCFKQNVFILKNKGWEHGRMLFPKSGLKFFGQPPHVQINL